MTTKEKPYFPSITTNSIDEFNEIYQGVSELPQVIIDRIQRVVKNYTGLDCTFKADFYRKGDRKIMLPLDTRQISEGVEEYIILTDKYVFRIPAMKKKELSDDDNFTFIFVDYAQLKAKETP